MVVDVERFEVIVACFGVLSLTLSWSTTDFDFCLDQMRQCCLCFHVEVIDNI